MTPDELNALAELIAEKLKASEPNKDIQWSEIDLPTASTKRPQCGELSDPTLFLLRAIAVKTYSGSMAELLRTAANTYLNRTWAKHLNEFKAIANTRGVTVEELLTGIVSGEIKL
ncbi:MAG: hypothetical protein AAF810_01355 [Cyanobacteria bacterium P01_D01_bin.36]